VQRPTARWTASGAGSGGGDRQVAFREPSGTAQAECRPGGDADVVVVGERGLRRVPQAEHGKPAVAPDEPDGEHAAVTPSAAL
jgi:hypothetical protein